MFFFSFEWYHLFFWERQQFGHFIGISDLSPNKNFARKTMFYHPGSYLYTKIELIFLGFSLCFYSFSKICTREVIVEAP